VCGSQIEASEIDIELELTSDRDSTANSHHFHVRCLAALEHEMRAVACADGLTTAGQARAAGARPIEGQPEA
jgi:hypothetical protein